MSRQVPFPEDRVTSLPLRDTPEAPPVLSSVPDATVPSGESRESSVRYRPPRLRNLPHRASSARPSGLPGERRLPAAYAPPPPSSEAPPREKDPDLVPQHAAESARSMVGGTATAWRLAAAHRYRRPRLLGDRRAPKPRVAASASPAPQIGRASGRGRR